MHGPTNRHVWAMEEKTHCRSQHNALETSFYLLAYAINFGKNCFKKLVYFEHRPGPAVMPNQSLDCAHVHRCKSPAQVCHYSSLAHCNHVM